MSGRQVPKLQGLATAAAGWWPVGGLVSRAVAWVRGERRDQLARLGPRVAALTDAMAAGHPPTARHARRVSEISTALGQLLRLDERRLFLLRTGALLHDIGKLTLPVELLDKPGRFTPGEYLAVQEHAAAGAAMLTGFDSAQLAPIRDIVLHHHERLDGSGYPDRLKGSQLSLEVRIVAVADVYDALTSSRPYRSRVCHAEAMGVLRQDVAAGRMDGRLVELLEQVPSVLADQAEAVDEVAATAAV